MEKTNVTLTTASVLGAKRSEDESRHSQKIDGAGLQGEGTLSYPLKGFSKIK